MNSVQNIIVDKCKRCRKLFIPKAYVCPYCAGEEFDPETIQGNGKIYTFTTIRVAPEAFKDEVPYTMAIIELPYSLRLTARMQIKENESMEIGSSVKCVRHDKRGYWFALS